MATAISVEHKTTMFEDIKTLKSGQKNYIYFTEHDIYFSEQLFILPNFTLLDFKSFDQAIVGLVFAHTSHNHNYDFLDPRGVQGWF